MTPSEEISDSPPQHVAVIMDGNRRWAQKHSLPLTMGHWEGARALTDIVKVAASSGIKTLTVYAFSTENWTRSQEEVNAVMVLFELYLKNKRTLMKQEGIRLCTIGDLSRLPARTRRALEETMRATEQNKQMNLVLALNYGGRDEITRAVKRIVEDLEKKTISECDLSERLIAKYLDTTPWGDPDLLIRTGGEFRLSNFMLWQLSYTELFVSDLFWPQFGAHDFLQVLAAYQTRKRRYGR